MTFRQLDMGQLFRFPKHDDPWRGSQFEGAFWKKVNASAYVNVKKLSLRPRIDDPNRSVYKEEKKKGSV